RRARRLTALTAASAVGALAMGALTLAALASRNEAQAQRAQAEGLVGFMLGDLRDKLEPLGRLDVLDAVGQRAMAYYNAQAAHGLDDEALGRRATVLHLLGEIQEKRGNLQDALREFKEASATTAELLTGRPDDGERVFNHAQSVYYVSEVADQRGEDQEALREALEYKRLAERLVLIDPKRGQEEVADANSDIGSLLLKNNRAPEALAFFRRALDVTQSLANKSPRDHDLQMELAQIHAWLSDAEIAAGELDAAIKDRLAEGQICRALLQKAPDDNAAEEDLVVNRTALGRLYARTGRLGDSIDELARAANEAERLMAVDRSNTEYQESAVVAFTALGESLMRRRSMAAAREAARRADTLAESLVSKDSTVNNWSGRQLGAARVLLMRVAVQAASDAGSCRQALAPAPRESARIEQLVFRRPNDLLLSRVAGEAAILEGDYEAVMGRPDRARTAWTKAEVNLAKSTAHGRSDAYDYASGALSQAQARLKRSATSGLQTTTASLGPIWNAARGPCAPAYADW
ncbi:MAG: hypothetical protein M3T55_08515, partial [Pseudomonadota bacterium]|nr:hypothetical protein [Pseudomonadota bacterium]